MTRVTMALPPTGKSALHATPPAITSSDRPGRSPARMMAVTRPLADSMVPERYRTPAMSPRSRALLLDSHRGTKSVEATAAAALPENPPAENQRVAAGPFGDLDADARVAFDLPREVVETALEGEGGFHEP